LIRGGEALIPDAPVEYSPLASWPVAPGKGASGLYSQSFNQAAAILALPEIGGLPLGAFLLEGPFLDALLAAGAERLPGAESLQALEPLATARAPLTQALLQGLALYGLPLTESLPRKDKETASYREAQRFSQGWMERTGKL
jgi:hypothetical protein